MDVLSEVLRVVRLSGVVHFRAEFTRPWSIISSPPEILTTRLMPGAESVTPFHVVTHGRCIAKSGTLPDMALEAGDVIVFPRGDQHILTSNPKLSPVPIKDIYRKPSTDQIAVVQHGGGGDEDGFICGFLHSDQRFGPLLGSLPTALCIRSRGQRIELETFSADNRHTHVIDNPGEVEWWQATLRYFRSETERAELGNHAVLARLSELMFMDVMRWQLRALTEGGTGWLAGLNDPQVGRAIALLHAQPSHPWTVDELADRAGISRSALAKRFADLVGEAPIQYLAGWRMHLARQMLRDSTLGIGEIAGRIGYESEAAFNRAFKRAVGSPPAEWRRSGAVPEATARSH
jgi:AraC-like DNA-binding protein